MNRCLAGDDQRCVVHSRGRTGRRDAAQPAVEKAVVVCDGCASPERGEDTDAAQGRVEPYPRSAGHSGVSIVTLVQRGGSVWRCIVILRRKSDEPTLSSAA